MADKPNEVEKLAQIVAANSGSPLSSEPERIAQAVLDAGYLPVEEAQRRIEQARKEGYKKGVDDQNDFLRLEQDNTQFEDRPMIGNQIVGYGGMNLRLSRSQLPSREYKL